MTIFDELAKKNQIENVLVYTTDLQYLQEDSSPDAEDDKENYNTYTVDITEKVAYLLGVEKFIFEKENHPFRIEIYDELEKDTSAKIIRTLSKFRIIFMRNFSRINSLMRYDLKNINTMSEFFNADDVKFLEDNGVPLLEANSTPQHYIIKINALIADKISQCKGLFPLWVEWDYIKELFIMPKGSIPDSVKNESNKFTNNLWDYPYSTYINFPIQGQGNVLYNDSKFLSLLYAKHGKKFNDIKKVTDASISTKRNIYNFLEENEGDVVIVVDGENSDAYRLYGTLKSLNAEEFKKIKKIILLSDANASSAWQMFEPLLKIPVEFMLINRVKDNKSLVDIKVTTETCREYYQNRIKNFILCSSDSDFWGLITALPDANFLVMIEDDKISEALLNAFDESNIPYASMDSFTTGNINEIKTEALKAQLQVYIEDHMNLNVNDMSDFAYTQTRIQMTDGERKQFYENYIKTMRFVIGDNGDVNVVIK